MRVIQNNKIDFAYPSEQYGLYHPGELGIKNTTQTAMLVLRGTIVCRTKYCYYGGP